MDCCQFTGSNLVGGVSTLVLGLIKTKPQKAELISEYDFYSYTESVHYHAYKFLGVNKNKLDDQEGISFGFWSNKVKAVSVVGDFNNWRLNANPLTKIFDAGLWSSFIPNLKRDFAYQFALQYEDGRVEYLNDPYARQIAFTDGASVAKPLAATDRQGRVSRLASVYKDDNYQWDDAAWIKQREQKELSVNAISIYRYDLAGEENNYQALAKEIVEEMKSKGFTHLLLSSVIDAIQDLSYGKDYQYFAANHVHGNPEDFKCFVNYLHTNSIGLVLDLPLFGQLSDYAKKTNNNMLLSSAIFWLEEYHIDGFFFSTVQDDNRKLLTHKSDALVEFMKSLTEVIYSRSKGVFTVIEDDSGMPELTKPTYRGGFGFNMNLNTSFEKDIVDYFITPDDLNKLHLNSSYAFAENQMLNFADQRLEALDLNTVKLILAYSYAFPGKKLISAELMNSLQMGFEMENSMMEEYFCTSPRKFLGLGSDEFDLATYVADLNKIYAENDALSGTDFKDSCFEWLNYGEDGLVSFLRWSCDYKELVLFIMNLHSKDIKGHLLGVPQPGLYLELFNSDAAKYAGLANGNDDGVYSCDMPSNNRPYSLKMDIPPRSALIFKNRPESSTCCVTLLK
jgi:1,4-alpha-glucan branching enzyme